jgi:uncharacterized protein (DUF305 family)
VKKIILGLALLILTNAACQSTANTNTNKLTNQAVANSNGSTPTAMNHDAMNHGAMNHGAMNHGAMNHSDMQSSPNAANAPYDLQFLDTMMAHHAGAVDMAKPVSAQTQNKELVAFAEKIIADQTREIAQMKQWREKWFTGKSAAMNMEMPGMRESMKMDMQALGTAKGEDFDRMFVEMMIPHHVGAVEMSKEALTKAEHSEIKKLSEQIIKSQEEEIKQMQNWKAKWAK